MNRTGKRREPPGGTGGPPISPGAGVPETRSPERRGVAETLGALERALAKAGETFPPTLGRVRDAAGRVRHAPSFVQRLGALTLGATTWIWCQPAEGAATGVAGQLVLDLPEGRYLCEVLDVAGAVWCSRESAAGNPLVIGLPALAGEAVVKIERVGPGR